MGRIIEGGPVKMYIPRLWRADEDAMPLWMLEEWGRGLGISVGPGATGTAMSDFLENETLDHLLSAATFTAAGTLYYALFTSAPTDAGGGTEVTGGAYARVSVTNNATNFPAASGGQKSNGAVITFPTATADWGTVTHMALIDNSVGGNYYFYGQLPSSRLVKNGDIFRFAVGNVTYALD